MKKSLLASPFYTVENKTNKGDFKTGLLNQFKKLVEKLCQRIFNEVQTASELKITECSDKSGNLAWRLHDPVTHNSFIFNDEEELKVWIEERYYRLGISG